MSQLIIHSYVSQIVPFSKKYSFLFLVLRRGQYVIIRTDGVETQLRLYRLPGQFTQWRQSYVRNSSLSVPALGPTLQKFFPRGKAVGI
jgi:hypothetical protein